MAIVSGSLMSVHVSAKSLGGTLVIRTTSNDKRSERIALALVLQIGCDFMS